MDSESRAAVVARPSPAARTKKQAQEPIQAEAERSGQSYVNNRWLGGALTNFQTIKQSIERLKKIEETLAGISDQSCRTAHRIHGIHVAAVIRDVSEPLWWRRWWRWWRWRKVEIDT